MQHRHCDAGNGIKRLYSLFPAQGTFQFSRQVAAVSQEQQGQPNPVLPNGMHRPAATSAGPHDTSRCRRPCRLPCRAASWSARYGEGRVTLAAGASSVARASRPGGLTCAALRAGVRDGSSGCAWPACGGLVRPKHLGFPHTQAPVPPQVRPRRAHPSPGCTLGARSPSWLAPGPRGAASLAAAASAGGAAAAAACC